MEGNMKKSVRPSHLLAALFLWLTLLCFETSRAASRGYLSVVGPAPIRFQEDSSTSSPARGTLTPLKLPLINPGSKVKPDDAPAKAVKTKPEGSPPASGSLVQNPTTVAASLNSNPPEMFPDEALPSAIATNSLPNLEPPLTPQMMMRFFQFNPDEKEPSKKGVLVPLTFTPPQPKPQPNDKLPAPAP
jgi:hypothetical protein